MLSIFIAALLRLHKVGFCFDSEDNRESIDYQGSCRSWETNKRDIVGPVLPDMIVFFAPDFQHIQVA